MKVHHLTPYDIGKNLGRAYNEAMGLLPDGDVGCLRDIDTIFLTPEQPVIIEEYARVYPDAILTCYTNRVSELSRLQLLGGIVSEDSNIRNHIEHAKRLQNEKRRTLDATEIPRDISGFLMVVPKSIWNQYPFPEDGKCLGVDTYYGRMIRAAGIKILRMDAIYIFHTYRMANGIKDKSHLV